MMKKVFLFSCMTFYCLANLQSDFDRAYTLNKQGNIQDASDLYADIVQHNSWCTPALYNYAHTLKDLGCMCKAVSIYQQVIEREPHNAFAHVGMAQCYLSLGQYTKGFELFEWRSSAIKDFKHDIEKLKKLFNNNANLTQYTILFRAEWGLGDNIQFIRFAQILKNRGATIIIQSYPALKQLFSLCPYLDKVISEGDAFPAHDMQIPLLSLAYICDATVENISNSSPYMYADMSLVKTWQSYFAKTSKDRQNFKVGICWSGNGDNAAPPLLNKNIPTNYFEPLLQLPNVAVYSLQQLSDEHRTIKGLHLFEGDFDKTHGRFSDTAAVMKNLDLVVTIDTSIAHLAGALGVPVFVILPHRTDWRWMLQGTNSPWYPSMTLLRQPNPGNWAAVIDMVITEIQGLTLQVHSPKNKDGLITLSANGEE